jgi:hypothetical protein
MKEELYYLVPKELMDKLMGELGSYAYINNCFTEMNGLNQQLTSRPLIDLSDEAIEDKFDNYFKKLNEENKYEDNYTNQVKSYRDYKAALTDLK